MTRGNSIKNTLLELLHINEVYPEENEVLQYCQSRLEKAEATCRYDDFHNLIATIPGTGDPVMLSTHVDIPEPVPQLGYEMEGDIIRSDGNGILGVDPKSGLAALLEFADTRSREDTKNGRPVEIVLTRGEEAGLVGARHLDYSLIQSEVGLVLDQDGPTTEVVTKAPAFVSFEATFYGKPAHPREPHKGINALTTACKALLEVPPGYSTEGVTWNVGLFNAGTAINTIPGVATLRGELRSYNSDRALSEAHRIADTYKTITARKHGECEVHTQLEFDDYELSRNHHLFTTLEETFDALSLSANYFETFGGTDANIFNANGITCVPVGSGYYNAHQYSEYTDLSDLEQIVSFLREFTAAR